MFRPSFIFKSKVSKKVIKISGGHCIYGNLETLYAKGKTLAEEKGAVALFVPFERNINLTHLSDKAIWDERVLKPHLLVPFDSKAEVTEVLEEYPIPKEIRKGVARVSPDEVLPNDDSWKDYITEIQKRIDKKELSKVVAARRFSYFNKVLPKEVFPWLSSDINNTNCYRIEYNFAINSRIVSCSPETLCFFKFKGDCTDVNIDILGGTKINAKLVEDFGEKNILEHRWIQRRVAGRLTALGLNPNVSELNVLSPHRDINHIFSSVTCRVDSSFNEVSIIKELHPTPAVCGVPRDKAFQIIANFEPYIRGLYGGIVAVITPKEVDVAVLIRLALVTNKKTFVYAGGGVVQGSNFNGEASEVLAKANAILGI